MNRSAFLQALAGLVDEQAGGYLDGIDRRRPEICEFCATPVAVGHGYQLCLPCSTMEQATAPTADRFGALIYAVMPGSQAYRLVHDYKAQDPGPSLRPIFNSLLLLGLRRHLRCLNLVAGAPVDAWAVVPSTRGRTVLREMVSRVLGAADLPEVPVSFSGKPSERTFAPDHWRTQLRHPSRHVILIDDSWVRGSHAQSVASSLKRAGAQQVSVFAVARVLSAKWPPSGALVDSLRGGTFDWENCPWAAEGCPVGH